MNRKETIKSILGEVKPDDTVCYVNEEWVNGILREVRVGGILVKDKMPDTLTKNVHLYKSIITVSGDVTGDNPWTSKPPYEGERPYLDDVKETLSWELELNY